MIDIPGILQIIILVLSWIGLPIPGVSKTNYICVELPLIVIKFKTVFVLEGCLLCEIKTGDQFGVHFSIMRRSKGSVCLRYAIVGIVLLIEGYYLDFLGNMCGDVCFRAMIVLVDWPKRICMIIYFRYGAFSCGFIAIVIILLPNWYL